MDVCHYRMGGEPGKSSNASQLPGEQEACLETMGELKRVKAPGACHNNRTGHDWGCSCHIQTASATICLQACLTPARHPDPGRGKGGGGGGTCPRLSSKLAGRQAAEHLDDIPPSPAPLRPQIATCDNAEQRVRSQANMKAEARYKPFVM